MIRKLLAASVAAGLAALALPALPASAAVGSSAQLTSASSVFPGARTFSVTVKNTETALIGGPSINAVRINFPVPEAGVTLASTAPTGIPPAGFTATATNLGSTQFITYRGGSIQPGQSATFTFPSNVLRPLSSDLKGDFVVQTSDDNLATMRKALPPAGATLTAAVEVLEILGGSVKPVAPTNADNTKGVTDRSGTAGQRVTYAYQVRNYAQNNLSVTPSLSSTDASDKPVAVTTPVTIPAGETATDVTVPIDLGTAPLGGQRSSTFTARADAAKADADPRTDSFTVQAPVALLASNLQPVRTKSSPKAADSSRTFTLDLAKQGVQAFTLEASTLRFGTNSASAATPVEYGNGAGSRNLAYKFASVSGADGPAAVTLANAGTDNNLAGVSVTLGLGNITIDNLAPIVNIDAFLPTDADGDQQVASSNNDAITIKGTIENEKDLDLQTLKVSIVPDKGMAKPVAVTTTTDSTTGTVTFTGTYNTATWEPGVARFQAFAAIEDLATNLGSNSTAFIPVDVQIPALAPQGVVSTPTTIDIVFVDPSGIRGGCDRAAYLIDGLPGQVTEVRNGDGSACNPKALDYSGRRMLVLSNALAPTDTPDVTYNFSGRTVNTAPAKDGAGNDAVTQTIETVSNVVPITPILVNVERRDGSGFEPAYRDSDDGGKYFTNATAADGNRVTVNGVRNGYVIQVRDAAGNVLAQADPMDQPATALNPSPSYSGTVNIPTGLDAAYDRFVFFVSSRGIASKVGLPLTLVVDTVSPGLGALTVSAPGRATQEFNEKVVAGSDVADNWFTTYDVATETGTGRRSINVDSVTTVDQRTRSLVFTPLEGGTLVKADYLMQSGSSYEDRAGNLIRNTLG